MERRRNTAKLKPAEAGARIFLVSSFSQKLSRTPLSLLHTRASFRLRRAVQLSFTVLRDVEAKIGGTFKRPLTAMGILRP